MRVDEGEKGLKCPRNKNEGLLACFGKDGPLTGWGLKVNICRSSMMVNPQFDAS